MTNDKPGTDWASKHDAAGANANQPQHENWTIADGTSVAQHQHPMTEQQVMDMVNGEGS
jgi:hypothetical protein